MIYLQTFTLLLLVSSISSTPICGSLITYRQYTDILEHAPPCFREGCVLGNHSTLSSNCPTGHPCSELWASISKHASLDWCASPSCQDDKACRTHGWPIINSTRLCQSQPDDWMYISGECCASGNEPFDIARWIKRHCTQEWRANFTYFGGMARDDWLEYILPWNWTIHYDDSTGGVRRTPKCHRPSYYLKLFALESLAIFLALISIPYIQLFFHYSGKWHFTLPILRSLNDSEALELVQRCILSIKWLWNEYLKVYITWPLEQLWNCLTCKPCRESSTSSSATKDVVQALSVAFVWAGLSAGVTIYNAFHIKTRPGFENIHPWRLAFLWFARPNFSWTTCIIGLFNRKRLVEYLERKSTKKNDLYVVGLWTKVAYSAAISELLMEMLGAYSLVRTTHIGRIREFYISHHLYQYYRGHAARRMYNGALVWAITVPILFAFWVLAALRFGKSVRRFEKATNPSEDLKNKRKENRKKFWRKMGSTFCGLTEDQEKDTTAVPKPGARLVKMARKDSSSFPYRLPNGARRFFSKYIIPGHVRRWFGMIIPDGKVRTWIRRHLLRAPLGDSMQRSLSRKKSIRTHTERCDSSSLLQYQEEMNTQPELEMAPISGTNARPDSPHRPSFYLLDPAPQSRDIISSSSYLTDLPREGFRTANSHESNVFLSAEESARDPTTSDRLHPEALQPRAFRRTRARPIADYSAYDTIAIDEELVIDNVSDQRKIGQGHSLRPTDPFTDPKNVVSGSGASQTGIAIAPQNTSYVHETPSIRDNYDPKQPRLTPRQTTSLLTWFVEEVLDPWEADRREEMKRYPHRWQRDTIRLKWMYLALILGLTSYVSQWMFWEGFVNVAGEK
ncbi:uncharacterized protein BDR25DRAFT_127717 [Lindgomyces ingoldianus]|uniref:Uncharacterized protein n=1 Tax=Lindgomyces ingoldianus TaxID=673940 RepID=A0ACB6Q7I8_9PLEO|nr:uncharacterized protein BDR25DRAFT_127717 [Lindgomyces ingoldianus]KAF2462563.1 hypothetical protein BDR25DRAFT_127717 [Lindgomyces ingoldianus]